MELEQRAVEVEAGSGLQARSLAEAKSRSARLARRLAWTMWAVGRGLADGEAGRLIPHEQVAADLRRKWLLGSVK